MATPIKDNINWRRHRTACPNYREDWKVEDALYRCICLAGTPPITRDEQDLCMRSRTSCWRLNPPSPEWLNARRAREADEFDEDDD
jgi:hypothetical protein